MASLNLLLHQKEICSLSSFSFLSLKFTGKTQVMNIKGRRNDHLRAEHFNLQKTNKK